MVITDVSYNKLAVKTSSPPVHMRGGNDEEHIITTGWWCKPAMMMDYHRRLVRRSGGDSYPPGRFYEPLVITIANSFNDIGSDRGVGDRPICSSNRLF